MTLSEARKETEIALRQVVGEDAAFEARELVAFVAKIDRRMLQFHASDTLSDYQASRLSDLLKRRIDGEPLQYLLGEWEFMGLPFFVSEDVLIPRQDTETVCETAIEYIRERGYRTVLDLCTGSGCIGIAIERLTGVDVTLADVSDKALDIAKRNAVRNNVAVTILQGDLFDAVYDRKFDLIICNPPYLTASDMNSLQREVTFEPSLALYGGEDGLTFYRRIAHDYRKHLNHGGVLVLEIGATQREAVSELFRDARTKKDYGGNDRVVIAEAE